MLLLNFNANRHKKVITFNCLKNKVYIYIEDSEKKKRNKSNFYSKTIVDK